MASGVQTKAGVPAASTGPPAAIEYALEPSAVATTRPSPASARVELVVDGDVGDELAGAAADHDEVVGGPVVGARPPGRSASAGSDRAIQSPAHTRSRASAIPSAATAVSAPRLPQATPRTGAPCGGRDAQRREHRAIAADSDDQVALLHGARRRELAVALAVDRELDHVDAVVGGPARDRSPALGRPGASDGRSAQRAWAPAPRPRRDLSPRRRTPGPRAPSPRAGACARPRRPPPARARR